MAWCPHCKEDRPITRQTFDGACRYCLSRESHETWCRGPVKGALDACQFCNEPIFAKAKDEIGYSNLEEVETHGREKKSPKSRPLFSPGTKKFARQGLALLVALSALAALVDIRNTDLTPAGIILMFLLSFAIWPSKARSASENKTKGGCIGKGCLGIGFLFALASIGPNLVKMYPLSMKITPGENALVEVEGPISKQGSGPDIVLNLPKGSYKFKITADGYKAHQGTFEIPQNKNLVVSLSLDNDSRKKQAPPKKSSANHDPDYPSKLVSVLSEPTEFNGTLCALSVEKEWQRSNLTNEWYATLRKKFGENEVSCLLESDSSSTVKRIELEAEFYQPGLYENEMLLQFAQSAQVLMHPATPPREFAEAVVNKSTWKNAQWKLTAEDYTNGGFGLTLRKL